MPRLMCLALVTTLFIPALLSAAEPPHEVKIEQGVTYATVGNEKLTLDLAIPAGDGPFPCVVMLHGGAWQMGSRAEFTNGEKDREGNRTPGWMEKLASEGYVTAAVSYRLAPKHKFPAMIEDARSAVRFLRANSKKYKIAPDRFAALGTSAGGHLALLCGLCDKSAGFDTSTHSEVSGRVQCVIDFFGPTDLTLFAATPKIEEGYLFPVFGKEGRTDPEVYKKASPLSYVSKDAPPILILHGTFDIVVPLKHSETLRKNLTDAGATVEMLTIPFGGHGGWNARDTEKSSKAVLQFLDKHLKGKK